MDILELSLREEDTGRSVTLVKANPNGECLERDDLVEVFRNFLISAGYVFPDQADCCEDPIKAGLSCGEPDFYANGFPDSRK